MIEQKLHRPGALEKRIIMAISLADQVPGNRARIETMPLTAKHYTITVPRARRMNVQ